MKNTTNLYTQSFFLIIAIAFSTQTCSYRKDENGCSQFRTGDFIYNFRGPQGNFSFLLSRNDSIQTEINLRTGDTSKLIVTWTNDCNYELRLIQTTAVYPDSIMRERKRLVLENEIISWTNDYYLFKSTQRGNPYGLSDTLWIKK